MYSEFVYKQIYNEIVNDVKKYLKTNSKKTLLEIIDNLYNKYESRIRDDHFDPVLFANFVSMALKKFNENHLVSTIKTDEARNPLYVLNWCAIIKEYVIEIFEEFKNRDGGLTTAAIFLRIISNKNIQGIIDGTAFVIDCVGVALEELSEQRQIKRTTTNISDMISISTYEAL